MTTLLSVRVYGTPRPQGSARAFVVGGRARITSDNKHLHGWRDDIKAAVIGQCAMVQRPTPVYVAVDFLLPRPAGLAKTKATPHTKKPDLDKLVRGCLDALTEAGAIEDDSQVTSIITKKRYAEPGEAPGAQISMGLYQEVKASEAPTTMHIDMAGRARAALAEPEEAQHGD